jgi:hypothetical protein
LSPRLNRQLACEWVTEQGWWMELRQAPVRERHRRCHLLSVLGIEICPGRRISWAMSLRSTKMIERSDNGVDIHDGATQITSIKIVGGIVLFVVVLLAAYMTS